MKKRIIILLCAIAAGFVLAIALRQARPPGYREGAVVFHRDVGDGYELIVQAYRVWDGALPVYLKLEKDNRVVANSPPVLYVPSLGEERRLAELKFELVQVPETSIAYLCERTASNDILGMVVNGRLCPDVQERPDDKVLQDSTVLTLQKTMGNPELRLVRR